MGGIEPHSGGLVAWLARVRVEGGEGERIDDGENASAGKIWPAVTGGSDGRPRPPTAAARDVTVTRVPAAMPRRARRPIYFRGEHRGGELARTALLSVREPVCHWADGRGR